MQTIYASSSDQIEQREMEHMALARQLAGECQVLLKNNGTLPIKPGKIALFGNGVRATIKGGTGSGDVNTRSDVTIEQGFINAGFEITTADWLNRQEKLIKEKRNEYLLWMKEEAARKKTSEFAIAFDSPFTEPATELIRESDVKTDADIAVYVIARNSGEGSDRYDRKGDYLPFDEEIDNIKYIADCFEKTVVVLNIGGIMDMKEIHAMQGVGAILLMTQLGNVSGDALVDVMTGAVNPSGKTADTWAVNYLDYPSSAKFSHNESVHDEMYEEGIYVGYRYFDTFGVKPLYPFGYGLSYTSFSISTRKVSLDGENIAVEAVVKNIGDRYAGKEVVQLYYSAPVIDLDKPAKELAAYKKTSLLPPGAEEVISLEFNIKDMASYSEKEAAWILEAGEYKLSVGNSSVDMTDMAVIDIKDSVITQIGKNLFLLDAQLQELKPEKVARGEEPSELYRIEVDSSQICLEKMKYQETREEYATNQQSFITMTDVLSGRAAVEELVSQLTVEEMATLCVGTMREGKGSIVGNASHVVPGAAGDTSPVCKETRGIKNLILADGPAGLRLQPHFKTDKNGNILPGGEVMGDFVSPFSGKINEENSVDYYQYCTAIPIGWALAQSWNLELIEETGDMIGQEMEQFHVDLWLAPALNIHRNPLCGRNFEYYSEDPVVSGMTAAAMTKGVQKHNGKGVTIKHFAVNNQEDNRYFVNAHVSERALREIYLKGFEIAVKKAQPLAVMTSYNLLNGIHTANHRALIQSMLRDEWGFKGTVMTDWFTSVNMPGLTGKYEPRYPISASTGCIYAGNDIQMPGCQKNVDDIIEAVTTGKEIDGYKITKADLQFNSANVVRVVAQIMASEISAF